MSAAAVSFVDTMRLSLCRGRAKDEWGQAKSSGASEDARRKTSFEEAARSRLAAKQQQQQRESRINESIDEEHEEEEEEEKVESHKDVTRRDVREPVGGSNPAEEKSALVSQETVARASSSGRSCLDEKARSASNVCKITVSPLSAPPTHLLVHRLQVGSTSSRLPPGPPPPPPPHGTSIIISGVGGGGEQDLDNKVTINVGGQSGLCNPTVISVNSSAPDSLLSIQQTSSGGEQKRTLVILDNYKSNIVIGGERSREQGAPSEGTAAKEAQARSRAVEIREPRLPKFQPATGGGEESSEQTRTLDAPVSKEEMISKLLEDSLRKARENGEILDEGSGEAILKILKQSLLKSSAAAAAAAKAVSKPEPAEPAGYFGPSRTRNANELLSSSPFFAEENAYEVIKEPIYEEIADEPPPLPTSPPPSDADLLKNRLFFGDEYGESSSSCSTRTFRDRSTYYEPLSNDSSSRRREYLECSYLSRRRGPRGGGGDDDDDDDEDEEAGSFVVGKASSSSMSEKLLNFILDSEKCTRVGNVSLEEELQREREEDEEDEEDEEEEEEEEEDPERDLEALYEQQKETSLGDLSSKSSQISNVSDSSEECNIILTNSPEALKTRTVDIERTDSGVGSESSQASSGRGIGRRWRSANNKHHNGGCSKNNNNNNNNNGKGGSVAAPGATTLKATHIIGSRPAAAAAADSLCEDCEQRLEPLIIDSAHRSQSQVGVCCRKCGKKRAERKEIVTEIVETEQKYGRDLQIILEEFHRPMLRAGLLTPEQLSAIFLNVEELLEHNQILADKLKDAVGEAQRDGDEDLVSVDLGKIFLESERMLHAFESYCTRQGGASLLLQNLEKEKELLRIFLKVSQMENAVLRRMNLNSFLMVPVQRVTKYPLLLARLQKATPSGKPQMQELKKRLKEAQTNIELHLEHMNAEAKDITSTRLWRRISIIQQNGRRSSGEQDMVNIKLRKMAVEVLEWPHEGSRFVLEGRLLVAQPTDNNWRRGRTVKLAPITAMLVTRNGKPNNLLLASTESLEISEDCLFPRQIGVKDATLLLVKEKLGRYSLLREPLYLDKCIVCSEADVEDYFEIQELTSKETFIFKAEDGERTKRWCRTLQAHAQSLGAWRRRRGALPNIMICGVARS